MRHHNDGLRKRCACPRRVWAKCRHPWHFGFHYDGREYRLSLHKVVDKPASYHMSKTEAQTIRDRLRDQIRAGTFTGRLGQAPAVPTDGLTCGEVCDRYIKRHVEAPSRRKAARRIMRWHLGVLRRTQVPVANGRLVKLEDKPLNTITKADVEAIRDARRHRATEPGGRIRPGVKGGEVGINRLLARLRHLFSWAIAEGYVTETPFKRHGVTVIRLDARVETPRHRRLEPGEEERLLAAAGPHLRALLVALLSTGCRVGELLHLKWHQVRRDEAGVMRWIVLPATNTKTYQLRAIPIGTRLRAELEMRRLDPDGEPHVGSAHVFGTDVGEFVATVKTAWRGACRRAGIADLQIRDLRREFASRLRESGASDHDVAAFLGHANITTTSRYLASTPLRLEQAIAHLEASTLRTSVAQTPESSDSGTRPPSPEAPEKPAG